MSENDASRILMDNSRVMFQIVASLTDDSRGVIYNVNMFIVQATGLNFMCKAKNQAIQLGRLQALPENILDQT